MLKVKRETKGERFRNSGGHRSSFIPRDWRKEKVGGDVRKHTVLTELKESLRQK